MTSRPPFRRVAALLALLGLVLAGCTTTTAQTTGTSDGAGVIGITLPSSDDAAWVRAGAALRQALQDRGYRVDLQYAAGDARTQNAQVQNMLTKSADAIVVAPISGDALAASAEGAETEGVPVAVFGRGLPVAGADFAAVVDPDALGRAQAEALLDAVNDAESSDPATTEGAPTEAPTPDADSPETAPPAPLAGPARVSVLAGAADDPWEQRRHAAALDALAPAVAEGRIALVSGESWADAAVADDPLDVPAAAEKRARAVLAAIGPDSSPASGTVAEGEARATDALAPTTAILALGDDVTRGVVTALTTDPPADETPSPSPSPTPTVAPAPLVVVGSGADTVTVRALEDGVVAATLFVDTRELAGPTADAVQALREGRTPTADGTEVPGLTGVPAVAVGPRILHREQIEQTLIETGWLTPEELSG